jgi:hypothetical protein
MAQYHIRKDHYLLTVRYYGTFLQEITL